MSSAFEIHWSLVPAADAAGLAPAACRLLAVWPAPVNHDACFEAAGFTLFGDNDEAWDRNAGELVRRVLEGLGRFGAVKLASPPLRSSPPWYLRPFRPPRELPLLEQAVLPMHWDSLPLFHAVFGGEGAALRAGNGHVLLWITLPHAGPTPEEFVREVAEPWPLRETSLRWNVLLPGHAH